MSILKSENVMAQHHEHSSDLQGSDHSTLQRFKNGKVKDPQPIDDANDPLNWSSVRKLLIVATLGIWIFTGTLSLIIASPTFVPVSIEFGVEFALTSYLVAGPLLAYGMASLFWVAAGNRFGVRLCFILSAIVASAFSIWGAKSNNFGQLIAARTLAAIAFASPETLGPQVVGDVFFLKDRAKCMSFVTAAQSTGFAAGALVGNFVISRLGWRWTQWIMAILSFSVAIMMLLFFPETQYTADMQFASSKRRFVQEFNFTRVSGGGRAKVHSFLFAFLYPFRYLRHPVVLIVTSYFSLYIMVTNYILTDQSLSYLLVYKFSSNAIGLTYIAPILGVWCGMLYCGLFQDTMLNRAKRHKKFEPEQRIPFLILGGIVGTAGTILFGTCTKAQCNWFVPLIGSFGTLFGFSCAGSISFTYLVDVYLARGDATLVIVNGFKNFVAFGITYAIIPWDTKSGYAIPYIVLGAVVFGAHLIMLVLWWKGEAIRAWTAERYEEARGTHHGDAF